MELHKFSHSFANLGLIIDQVAIVLAPPVDRVIRLWLAISQKVQQKGKKVDL